MVDVVAQFGAVMLGSRLKRLGERLQGDAARVLEGVGLTLQPAHVPVVLALQHGGRSIGQIAEAVGASQPGVTRAVGQLAALGLVETQVGADLRQRHVFLTDHGEAAVQTLKATVWPRLGQIVDDLAGGQAEDLLNLVGQVERALDATSMAVRFERSGGPRLTLHEYRDDLAADFARINAEWIEAMFRLEPTDREVLDNPREKIIDPGGAIMFVEAEGLGIVGACALQKTGDDTFELTKMGVSESARGMKVGEFLLRAMIDRARAMGATTLYLLTNHACEAAIHLYEKLGFCHDAGIMAQYGARYARCDVAMLFPGQRLAL